MAVPYTAGLYTDTDPIVVVSSFPDLGNWGGKLPADADASQVSVATQLAWVTMLRLAGGSVVTQPVMVRPVARPWPTPDWSSRPIQWFPTLMVCQWVDWDVVRLQRPVGRVVQVRVDGVTLAPYAFRVEGGDRLVRQDGLGWPQGQDPSLVPGSVGTWDITYYPGARPDGLFVWATGQLAAEFYTAVSGGRGCRLPAGVTSVVRQGVSFDIQAVPFTNGRTGIIEIDAVLSQWNPNGLQSRPTVTSPDSVRSRPKVLSASVGTVSFPNGPAVVGQDALAQNVVLRLSRGSDFDAAFVYKAGDLGSETPVDLTGWSAAMQVRANVGGAVWLSLASPIDIMLGADGSVRVHIDHEATETPEWDSYRQGVWDLELTSPSDRRVRFAEGVMTVSQDVTR